MFSVFPISGLYSKLRKKKEIHIYYSIVTLGCLIQSQVLLLSRYLLRELTSLTLSFSIDDDIMVLTEGVHVLHPRRRNTHVKVGKRRGVVQSFDADYAGLLLKTTSSLCLLSLTLEVLISLLKMKRPQRAFYITYLSSSICF